MLYEQNLPLTDTEHVQSADCISLCHAFPQEGHTCGHPTEFPTFQSANVDFPKQAPEGQPATMDSEFKMAEATKTASWKPPLQQG